MTIHHYSIDVAHGLVLLFGIGTRGPSVMGFEDEAEQSIGRPCRQTNGRSKSTCELTSSIVPRGTSFHRWADRFLVSDLISYGSHAAATKIRFVGRDFVAYVGLVLISIKYTGIVHDAVPKAIQGI